MVFVPFVPVAITENLILFPELWSYSRGCTERKKWQVSEGILYFTAMLCRFRTDIKNTECMYLQQ